jgi:hypothetical protein
MHQIIGIALVLTLAVMPTLAWVQAQAKFPARYPWVIATGATTSPTPPAGQGSTPPAPSIEAAVAVPNFIVYRDRNRVDAAGLTNTAESADDANDPTGILGSDNDFQQ